MFDYHMHSIVSFDGHDSGLALAQAAKAAGLKEICFTDHMDYIRHTDRQPLIFDLDTYSREYDALELPGLKIRRGMEFGLYTDNTETLKEILQKRRFDYVLGSVHFVDDLDVYFAEYWEGKTIFQAQRRYFEEMLACVQVHEDYDVLAHMTYLHKSRICPATGPLPYADHAEIIDEILRTLAQKGKGLELNTSGLDRCGGFLPTPDYFRRFRELGGEIVTIGSDAHRSNRVGQYANEACEVLKEIFGYVCTFEERNVIFHKL